MKKGKIYRFLQRRLWDYQNFIGGIVCRIKGCHTLLMIGDSGTCDADGKNYKPETKLMSCIRCKYQTETEIVKE